MASDFRGVCWRKGGLYRGTSQSFIGEYEQGSSYGDAQKQQIAPQIRSNVQAAIPQGKPDEAHRDDLGVQGEGFVFAEMAYIGTQVFLVEEPMVQAGGTSEIEGRCQE